MFGFGGIVLQLWWQKKKEKTELILKLYAEFFNNSKYMSVFKILDSEKLIDVNASIRNIIAGDEIESIDGEAIEGVEEIDLNSYMNFFNSLAVLVEERIVSQSDVMKLFRYQLEKTFASIEMIRYMEDYGFERVKKLLPQSFFFYGTLQNEKDREALPEVKEIAKFLKNGNDTKLENFKIESVGPNHEYKGLVKVKGEKGTSVKGCRINILENSDWTKIFTILDHYEEIDELYVRAIVKLNNNDKYYWIYLKK